MAPRNLALLFTLLLQRNRQETPQLDHGPGGTNIKPLEVMLSTDSDTAILYLGEGWSSGPAMTFLLKYSISVAPINPSMTGVNPLLLFCDRPQARHGFHNSEYLKRRTKAPEGKCKSQIEGKKAQKRYSPRDFRSFPFNVYS